MVVSRSRIKMQQCSRFLHKYELAEGSEEIPLLDFYHIYREAVAVNALGYELQLKEFQEELEKKFPDIEIKHGVIHNLRLKPPKKPPEAPKVDPFDRLMLTRCHAMAERERRPYFTAKQLQNYQYMDDKKVSLDDVLGWLNDENNKFIFYNKANNCYHFNNNYEYIIDRLSI